MNLTGALWRKSSFSGNQGNSSGCVEVAVLTDGAVAVRDTKDRSLGAQVFPPREWAAFVAGVRAGEFDLP
ncbi:hypothetical protein GCM10009609_12030 [Pseudonocardia aurantiaca]|uniref:DUF397 domain-containing protein n=1 Tax=Pseudonocardia aurantiaca TaxID=75290 RepID=A0ABW4FBT7_9PSEU